MTAEVAPARLRGTAFCRHTWLGALLGGVTAPWCGALAGHWPIIVHGKKEGNLAPGLRHRHPVACWSAPVVVLNGRRHVSRDTARARAEAIPG